MTLNDALTSTLPWRQLVGVWQGCSRFWPPSCDYTGSVFRAKASSPEYDGHAQTIYISYQQRKWLRL